MPVEIDAIPSAKSIGWADALLARLEANSIQVPRLTIPGGTVTADSPALNITQTWNNVATTFTCFKANVTDTASNASSLLLDLQVGGASRFGVRKDGGITSRTFASSPGGISASCAIGADGTTQYSLHWGDANNATADFIFYSPGNPATVISNKGGTTSTVSLSATGVKLSSTSFLGWGASHAGRESLSATSLSVGMDAANTLALRNGTNNQTFNIYNTYTDASNYERGFARWSSSVFQIGTEAGGTGLQRNIALVLGTTRTYTISSIAISPSGGTPDLGASAFKWGNLYLGFDAHIGRNIVGHAGYHEMVEMTAPSAPSANNVRIYAEDNGSGKTRLMALFATGAAQQIAIEP